MTAKPAPTLVGDGTGALFLDAPGIDAGALFDTVAAVLGRLPDGAILTVYNDDSAARSDATRWCAGHDVELLAVIDHEPHGATLALRRRDRQGQVQTPRESRREGDEPTEPPHHPRLPPKT